jgi:hypothetical protein
MKSLEILNHSKNKIENNLKKYKDNKKWWIQRIRSTI